MLILTCAPKVCNEFQFGLRACDWNIKWAIPHTAGRWRQFYQLSTFLCTLTHGDGGMRPIRSGTLSNMGVFHCPWMIYDPFIVEPNKCVRRLRSALAECKSQLYNTTNQIAHVNFCVAVIVDRQPKNRKTTYTQSNNV